MIAVVFHPAAKTDLADSVKWYNTQSNGLGNALAGETSKALEYIQQFPEMWPDVYDGIRRCPLQRFPYSILYQNLPDTIYVYAVMHNSRKPGYWLKRIDS